MKVIDLQSLISIKDYNCVDDSQNNPNFAKLFVVIDYLYEKGGKAIHW